MYTLYGGKASGGAASCFMLPAILYTLHVIPCAVVLQGGDTARGTLYFILYTFYFTLYKVAKLREGQRERLNEAKKKVDEELKAAHDEIVNVRASETAVRMELQVAQEDISKLGATIEELKAKIVADAERRKANLRKLEEVGVVSSK